MAPMPAEMKYPIDLSDDEMPEMVSSSDDEDADREDEEELSALGVTAEDLEDQSDTDQMTPMQIAVIVLDWMHTNKVTNVATDQIWKAIHALLPGVLVDTPTFNKIRQLVEK